MATVFKIKRSTTTDIPPSLNFGELAYSSIGTVKNLFIGGTDNLPVIIGGSTFVTDVELDQAIIDIGIIIKYAGAIDCSINPDYPEGIIGNLYIISVAGKIGGLSGINVEIGDQLLCKETGITGDQSISGSFWNIIQANINNPVSSSSSTAVVNNITTMSSTNGKIIKDSGISIDNSSTLVQDTDTTIPTSNVIYADLLTRQYTQGAIIVIDPITRFISLNTTVDCGTF
jgi:hypothetical protein